MKINMADNIVGIDACAKFHHNRILRFLFPERAKKASSAYCWAC